MFAEKEELSPESSFASEPDTFAFSFQKEENHSKISIHRIIKIFKKIAKAIEIDNADNEKISEFYNIALESITKYPIFELPKR